MDAAWSKCIPKDSRFGVPNLGTVLESSVLRTNRGRLTYCLYEVAVLVSTCGRIRLGMLSFSILRCHLYLISTMASMEGRLMKDE
jgi:hypothetical protein